jgi:hypothetical protein
VNTARIYLTFLTLLAACGEKNNTPSHAPPMADAAGGGGATADSGAGGAGVDLAEEPRDGGRDGAAGSPGADASAAGGPTWTVFIYGNGDNSLNWWLGNTQEQLKAAPLGSRMRVVFLADYDASQFIGGGKKFPTGSHWFVYPPGPNDVVGGVHQPFKVEPEQDLDEPAVLTAAIKTAFQTFPADRYGLVMWDHGGSWTYGFGGDVQDGTRENPPISLLPQVLARAVQMGMAQAGLPADKKLEFFGYDACLMATPEVALPMRGITDTYIASAEIDYGSGWDYGNSFAWLAQHPAASMADFAREEVRLYDVLHLTAGLNDKLLRSHVAIDLPKLAAFSTAMNAVSAAIKATPVPAAVARAGYEALPVYSAEVDDPNGPDGPIKLRDAGQVLAGLEAVAGDPALAPAARAAREAWNAARIAGVEGDLRKGQAGLQIFVPVPARVRMGVMNAYQNKARDWNTLSGWGSALQHLADVAPQMPALAPAMLQAVDRPTPANPTKIVFDIAAPDVARVDAFLWQPHPTKPSWQINNGQYALQSIGMGHHELRWDGSVRVLKVGATEYNLTNTAWVVSKTATGLGVAVWGWKAKLTRGNGKSSSCSVLYDPATGVADKLVITGVTSGRALLLADLLKTDPGATITPMVETYNVTADVLGADEPSGPPIPLPASGTFTVTTRPASAGAHEIDLQIFDVWGNQRKRFFPMTLTGP